MNVPWVKNFGVFSFSRCYIYYYNFFLLNCLYIYIVYVLFIYLCAECLVAFFNSQNRGSEKIIYMKTISFGLIKTYSFDSNFERYNNVFFSYRSIVNYHDLARMRAIDSELIYQRPNKRGVHSRFDSAALNCRCNLIAIRACPREQ